VARSGGAIDSGERRKNRKGGTVHMGQSGMRWLGRPGEAAQAVKGLGLGANKNIETLFYVVWI
jgi:hypothetical protein